MNEKRRIKFLLYTVCSLLIQLVFGTLNIAESKDNLFESAIFKEDFRDNLYIYIKNPTSGLLEIEEIYIDGKSIKDLAAKGQDVAFNVSEKGVVRWYDVVPDPILPGRWGAVRIRFGDKGNIGEKVRVKVSTKGGVIFEQILNVVTNPAVKFKSYSFNEELTKLYLYIEKDKSTTIEKILIDGQKVRFKVKEIEIDNNKLINFFSITCPKRFNKDEYKIVKVITDNGDNAVLVKVTSPFFPIGLWCLEYDEGLLNDSAKHLINFGDVPLYPPKEPYYPATYVPELHQLDEKYGIKMFIHPINAGSNLPYLPWVKEFARKYPVCAWLVWDEPEVSDPPLNQPMYLMNWMKSLRRDGSSSPVFVNHLAEVSSYYEYNFTDIMSFDLYPVPGEGRGISKPNRGSLYVVSEETDKARDAVAPNPVWYVAQAYYGQIEQEYKGSLPRFPTPEEERLIVYESVSHGAKGIIYFSIIQDCFRGIAKFLDQSKINAANLLWEEIGKINLELHLLSDLLLKGEPLPLAESDQPQVESCALLCRGDTLVIFVLNHDYDSTFEYGKAIFRTAKDVRIKVNIPKWFVPKEVFKIEPESLRKIDYKKYEKTVSFSLDEVRVSEIIILTMDKDLFAQMEEKRGELYLSFSGRKR